jgi:hypothetical protein
MDVFATSYGKSATDDVGESVQRMATMYNFQRPLSDQITTPSGLYDMCSRSGSHIHFVFIATADMIYVRESLKERFKWQKRQI